MMKHDLSARNTGIFNLIYIHDKSDRQVGEQRTRYIDCHLVPGRCIELVSLQSNNHSLGLTLLDKIKKGQWKKP